MNERQRAKIYEKLKYEIACRPFICFDGAKIKIGYTIPNDHWREPNRRSVLHVGRETKFIQTKNPMQPSGQ